MRGLAWTAIGAFLLVIAEITVFVLVAKAIGWGWAVVLGLATMVVGGLLVKREGVRAWRSFRDTVNAGRPAGGEVTHGLTGLLGAILLIVPGFITDAAGLLLLAPPVRAFTGRQVRRVAERRISTAAAGGLFGPRLVQAERVPETAPAAERTATGGDVVEGEIIDPR